MSCTVYPRIRLIWSVAVGLLIPLTARAESTAIAFSGQPFGVGLVTIKLDPSADTYPVD